MADELLIVALARNCVDLGDLLQGAGVSQLDIAHERLDRGEPQIAGRRTVATIMLDVMQERDHHVRINLLELEQRGARVQAFGGKAEQQPEAVRISLAGVRTVAALLRHVLAHEAGDEWGDRRHATSPAIKASAAPAMSAMRSGVASIYQ